MEQGEGVRREPQGSTIPTPRFAWVARHFKNRTGEMMGNPYETSFPGSAPLKIPRLGVWTFFSAGRSISRPKYALTHHALTVTV